MKIRSHYFHLLLTASSVLSSIAPAHAQQAVCSEVRLQISQDAVLTRTGFRATLEVNNGSGSPLYGLAPVVHATRAGDPTGASANAAFVGIGQPVPTSGLPGGTLPPKGVPGSNIRTR